jgi:hypothetical protein
MLHALPKNARCCSPLSSKPAARYRRVLLTVNASAQPEGELPDMQKQSKPVLQLLLPPHERCRRRIMQWGMRPSLGSRRL